MTNWTNEYERQPVRGSNPGFIAQAVRTLKSAISERLSIEHLFGAGEATDPGVHREGSARALVQDTAFAQNLPVGEGLLAFQTLEEAVAGAEAIVADYEKHSRAARLVAEEFFYSDKVLGKMLEEIGGAP